MYPDTDQECGYEISIGERPVRIFSRFTNSVKHQPAGSPYKWWYFAIFDKLTAHLT